MKGTFSAVGTFETRPSIPVGPIAVVLLVAALVSYLATILLVLAIIAGVLAVIGIAIIVGFWLLRPRSATDTTALSEQAAGVNAELAARLRAELAARTSPPPVENHYHQHVHLPPGTDARGINWAALPVRNAAEFKER